MCKKYVEQEKKISRFASPHIYHLGVSTKVPIKCYYRQIMSAFLKFYMAFMEGVDVRLAWRRVMTKILGNVGWHVLFPIEHRYGWHAIHARSIKFSREEFVCLFVCSIHRTQGVLKPNLFQCFLASENLVPPLRSQASLWPLLPLREPKLHRH